MHFIEKILFYAFGVLFQPVFMQFSRNAMRNPTGNPKAKSGKSQAH
jgi:hypothetical protein